MKLKKFEFTKKRTVVLILILAVVLGGFFFFRSRAKKEVTTSTVQRGMVKEELILTGAIKAEKHSLLSFPTSGKIAWVGVTEGQKVNKGQALTSLDKTTLNTVYQQSLNNYRNYQAAAESAVDSVKDHSKDESFAQKATRTAAEVARDNAYDAMLAAKYNLDNGALFAPFAGIVSSLPFTSPGVNVSLTDTVVEIVDPASVYFEVDADQSEVTSIKDGQEVVTILDSYSKAEFKGKVSFIAYTPKAGETGTIYKIKVKFDSGVLGESLLRVGMTGDAKFTLSQKESVLFVPSEFVSSDTAGKYLKLGKVNNKTYIEMGLEGEERIEVVSNKIKEGDTVYD